MKKATKQDALRALLAIRPRPCGGSVRWIKRQMRRGRSLAQMWSAVPYAWRSWLKVVLTDSLPYPPSGSCNCALCKAQAEEWDALPVATQRVLTALRKADAAHVRWSQIKPWLFEAERYRRKQAALETIWAELNAALTEMGREKFAFALQEVRDMCDGFEEKNNLRKAIGPVRASKRRRTRR